MTDMTSRTQNELVPLLGRYKVPREFYDEVHRQVTYAIPRRRFGKEYKAKNFVDPALWGDDKAIHILIGRCIAHLVANKKVDLCFVGCPRCTNKRYLRI